MASNAMMLVNTSCLPYGLGEAYSVLPTVITRIAFFVAKSYRKYRPVFTKPELIGTVGSAEVYQTVGERLDETDCDVYLELVRRACALPNNGDGMLKLSFDANEFLRAINKERGTNNLKGLNAAIRRLKRASFLFKLPSLRDYETSLVASIESDETTLKARRYYTLTLDGRMAKVFEVAHFTMLDLGIRKLLGSDYVAKKLYSFYASHTETRLIALSTARRFLGRLDETDRVFVRDVLKPALERLRDATGWHVAQYNDKRGGIELYFTHADKLAADKRVKERQASGNSEKVRKLASSTCAKPARERVLIASPVSIELESWMREQATARLEEIATAFNVFERVMSRYDLESAMRDLYLSGTTLAVLKTIELDDI